MLINRLDSEIEHKGIGFFSKTEILGIDWNRLEEIGIISDGCT